jgi:transposase InsO family protein
MSASGKVDPYLETKSKIKSIFHAHKGSVGKVASNTLSRNFVATQLNQKWVTDVTDFNIKGDKAYLTSILDLYNQEIISYEIADRPQISMVMQILKSAFKRLGSEDKPLLHSDRVAIPNGDISTCPPRKRTDSKHVQKR